MGRCTGRRCPAQVGYDVANCNQFDCIFRTEINTNYDRIKSMSVEEMAGLIVDFHFVFQCKSYGLDPKTTYENMSEEDKKKNKEWEEEMRPIWERWLLQEVSEDDR